MSYNLLKGKRGIVFGALNEQSIAWKVAEKAVEEGAMITLSNTPVAVRMGEISALAEKLNCEVIPADATSVEDLENVFKRSMEVLGGKIDFVLHSIGMSPNVRKKRTYDDLDYDMLNKTLDISAISFHKMIQSAKKLDAINELRKEGVPLMEAIHEAGRRRLRPIIMTSLTTIFGMVPLLFTFDMGSELQKPLSIAMISAMLIGTAVSLFVIPLIYWFIYRKHDIKKLKVEN